MNDLNIVELILRRWHNVFFFPHVWHVTPIVGSKRYICRSLRRVEDEIVNARSREDFIKVIDVRLVGRMVVLCNDRISSLRT